MLLILMLLILFKEVRVLANYPNTRDIGPGWSSTEFLDFVEGGGGVGIKLLMFYQLNTYSLKNTLNLEKRISV